MRPLARSQPLMAAAPSSAWVLSLLIALFVAGCAGTARAPKLKDGELGLPADYKNWPKFLSAVQRPDAKQVREIYMNPIARTAKAGQSFADGSLLVMENYAAQTNPDGTLKTGADGKLVKGNLLRVFVMGRNRGWGQDVPEPLRNGNWIYSRFQANGQPSTEDIATCRGCHAPLPTKDFVHRYDEYFAQR
jgi:hemoglobin